MAEQICSGVCAQCGRHAQHLWGELGEALCRSCRDPRNGSGIVAAPAPMQVQGRPAERGLLRCSHCGEAVDPLRDALRWNGRTREWEHGHGQAGHSPCRWFGEGPGPQGPSASAAPAACQPAPHTLGGQSQADHLFRELGEARAFARLAEKHAAEKAAADAAVIARLTRERDEAQRWKLAAQGRSLQLAGLLAAARQERDEYRRKWDMAREDLADCRCEWEEGRQELADEQEAHDATVWDRDALAASLGRCRERARAAVARLRRERDESLASRVGLRNRARAVVARLREERDEARANLRGCEEHVADQDSAGQALRRELDEALAALRRWREADRLEDVDVYDQAAEAADALLARRANGG